MPPRVTVSPMRRGEVRLADLDPVRGSEADKTRPVVLVSNDRANAAASRRGRGVVTVVPLTTNVARVYAFQVLVPAGVGGLTESSKAQAEQVRSVDVERIGRTVGRLPSTLMEDLDAALRLHLDL